VRSCQRPYGHERLLQESRRTATVFKGRLVSHRRPGHSIRMVIFILREGRKEDHGFKLRKKDYPEEIESHYAKSPYIKELCVLGVGDAQEDRFGRRVVPRRRLLPQVGRGQY